MPEGLCLVILEAEEVVGEVKIASVIEKCRLPDDRNGRC